ncbi:hypothetical protein HKBW3S42_01233, partial [Candidatus Hakubella thermalkaliphila]
SRALLNWATVTHSQSCFNPQIQKTKPELTNGPPPAAAGRTEPDGSRVKNGGVSGEEFFCPKI